MTTVASGFWTSAPAPVASAIGRKPSDATSAVVSTGRSRPSAASWAATSGVAPSARSLRICDTSTRPFRTATPKSAMKPTAAEMLSGIPRTASANTPPITANGTFR